MKPILRLRLGPGRVHFGQGIVHVWNCRDSRDRTGRGLDCRCAEAARISRLRFRRRGDARERQARRGGAPRASSRTWRRSLPRRRWAGRSASATRAGRRMASRPKPTPIRTLRRGLRSSTTASSRISGRCGRNSPPRAMRLRRRPIPRLPPSSSRTNSKRASVPRRRFMRRSSRLRGAFALVYLFEGEEDLLIGARQGAPLGDRLWRRAKCIWARTRSRLAPSPTASPISRKATGSR